mmetsp:Transcript_59449/g.156484  ORF Transcript_59449/g.156484 Transcript_59449/m.156484 type:complete len:324 (-) Transcript_59449:309-1280(-)
MCLRQPVPGMPPYMPEKEGASGKEPSPSAIAAKFIAAIGSFFGSLGDAFVLSSLGGARPFASFLATAFLAAAFLAASSSSSGTFSRPFLGVAAALPFALAFAPSSSVPVSDRSVSDSSRAFAFAFDFGDGVGVSRSLAEGEAGSAAGSSSSPPLDLDDAFAAFLFASSAASPPASAPSSPFFFLAFVFSPCASAPSASGSGSLPGSVFPPFFFEPALAFLAFSPEPVLDASGSSSPTSLASVMAVVGRGPSWSGSSGSFSASCLAAILFFSLVLGVSGSSVLSSSVSSSTSTSDCFGLSDFMCLCSSSNQSSAEAMPEIPGMV